MKIGIFGGSFNPIHNGHAIIAQHIITLGVVDRLWFMVSPVNPLKAGAERQVNDAHRLRMVEMVSRPLKNVEASAFEFSLPRPSYTIDTLNALQAKFPDDDFYLVIGADNWERFDQWRSSEEILSNYHLLVYPRPGCEVVIPERWRERVAAVDAPVIELSSTQIRSRLAHGQSVRYYVPDCVHDHIERHHLYQPITTPNTNHGETDTQ